MTFHSLAEIIREKTPPSLRQQDAIDQVLAVAGTYVTGGSSLDEARFATTARQRRLAVRNTSPNHPGWPALMKLIDDLVRQDPTAFVTSQGVIDVDEIMKAYGRTVPASDGRQEIQFPIRYPWKTKPDKDGGGGEKGEPVYRAAADRKPTYTEATDAERAENRMLEWWED